MKSNSEETDGGPSKIRLRSGMRTESALANASSSVRVMVRESSSCIERLSTVSSFPNEFRIKNEENGHEEETEFLILHSKFEILNSPPHMQFFSPRPMHPLQLLLLLLLH